MTGTYIRNREAVLGARVSIPLGDPAAAFEVIAEALGGRAIAGGWVDQLRAEVGEAEPWEHDPNCKLCGSWRTRLAGATS